MVYGGARGMTGGYRVHPLIEYILEIENLRVPC
jgi:hypothetical protein